MVDLTAVRANKRPRHQPSVRDMFARRGEPTTDTGGSSNRGDPPQVARRANRRNGGDDDLGHDPAGILFGEYGAIDAADNATTTAEGDSTGLMADSGEIQGDNGVTPPTPDDDGSQQAEGALANAVIGEGADAAAPPSPSHPLS